MESKRSPGICLVTFPSESKVPSIFVSDMIAILERLSGRLTVIGANVSELKPIYNRAELKDIGIRMHYIRDITPLPLSLFLWALKIPIIELKTSIELLKSSKQVDTVVFYVAYPYFLLPLITARLLGKKTVEVITRTRSGSDPTVIRLFRLQDPLFLALLDRISPESDSLVAQLSLEPYRNKIVTGGARFVDTTAFGLQIELRKRDYAAGYIGRLRVEKGLDNFVRAIPGMLEQRPDSRFLIAGEGKIPDGIMQIASNAGDKVAMPGWIGHEQMPACLNSLKLLVLPSVSEGLPTVVLEAMACGTPVLATAVGAIPEVITDGETGFLLEDNSPECIAKNVMRALEHPDLEKISLNARALIEQRYSFDAAVKRYEKIIDFS